MQIQGRVQDSHYKKAFLGQRAQFALEELKDFLKEMEESLVHRLLKAADRDEAWDIVLQYKAYNNFVSSAEAAVIKGTESNEILKLDIMV